jgi:predicted RNase H-like HicB family nuclease
VARKAAKTYRYSVEIIPEEDGKGYYAVVPSLPGCFSQGPTIEETNINIREAISLHIAALKKSGQAVPSESGDAYKTVVEVAA